MFYLEAKICNFDLLEPKLRKLALHHNTKVEFIKVAEDENDPIHLDQHEAIKRVLKNIKQCNAHVASFKAARNFAVLKEKGFWPGGYEDFKKWVPVNLLNAIFGGPYTEEIELNRMREIFNKRRGLIPAMIQDKLNYELYIRLLREMNPLELGFKMEDLL